MDHAVGDSETLPIWRLDDLYAHRDSPEIAADFDRLTREAKAFRAAYEGKLAALDGAAFLAAIRAYEALQDLAGKLGSYAQLSFAEDMGDPERARFQQTVGERLNSIALDSLFFGLEINRLADADIAAKLAHEPLARYRPWIEAQRALRPHQLSDEVERLLLEKSLTAHQAWSRLFDETIAALRFPLAERELTIGETLDLLQDRDGEKRRLAAAALAKGLADHRRLFAQITNTLAKDKEIEDRWRHFPRPDAARHLANQVEPEIVDALVAAVMAAYPNLSHRYYRLKARWFGAAKLAYWDRNAPLPGEDDSHIPWSAARDLVLAAYRDFSPALADLGRRFFAKPWIDAALRPGKDPGAFAHPTVPSAHPYLLVNYRGRQRDVMTLAHELGHGVHQLLAAEQGALLADTPLTLAETASVFGEMLTFRALLAAERDPRRRRILLAGKVEDMLNTVIRQIAMHDFERRLHAERQAGELLPDRIDAIWLETQRAALGDGIDLPEDSGYRHYWAYIPHFIHVPFYVYAYAFGDCLVNSLYAVYGEAPSGFPERYLDLLRAGGSKRHKALLSPFGLDAADPEFWAKGLAMISGFIDELEAM